MRKLVTAFMLTMVMLAFMCSCRSKTPAAEDQKEQVKGYESQKNIECLYYNEEDFIKFNKFEIKQDVGTIRGCIVPHHLLARDLIHEVFRNVSRNKYKTVILIGPDHESINMGKIHTTLKNWQTPMGILETDRELTTRLLNNGFVEENDEKMTIEHSISGIVPFIKYYMGDVKVVTLAMTKQTKPESIDKITKQLYELVNKDETLFIASVDFSHYLKLGEADAMDEISMEAIKNKDINKIMSFTNDNLDSPVSIVTMLKMMDLLGTENSYVLNRSNSDIISKMQTDETTSYITYLFY